MPAKSTTSPRRERSRLAEADGQRLPSNVPSRPREDASATAALLLRTHRRNANSPHDSEAVGGRGYSTELMPDLLKSLGLDVYALTDADTDEAKAFTTYLGYWVSLAEHIEQLYGDPPCDALNANLQASGLSRLS